MSYSIFIVEDDKWYGEVLKHHLSLNPEYDVHLFESAKDLLASLYKNPNLICMDFGLPDMQGDQLLREIKKRNPNTQIIIISAQEEISVAVNLLKQGADDYIVKNDHTQELLWNSVIKLKEKDNLKKEVEVLKEQLESKFSFEKSIIGQSSAIKKTFQLLNKAVKSSINVSLSGDTGTGKEVFAKAIHFNSERKKKPFVAINMASIPKELVESELFGHEKGAFTGANTAKPGKFEEASGGTLFLDEIGELDLSIQSKLLRVLQEREVTRLGSTKSTKIDIRLITATHKNLAKESKEGNFREDLFFRIVGLPIHLPPLKDRDNDVLILAKHFIEQYAKENKTDKPILSSEAQKKLKKHTFPGNVRELKAAIDLACVMCEDNTIEGGDINFYDIGESKPYDLGEKSLKDYENEIIKNYLEKHDNNVLLVADKLQVGKSKIYNLLKSGEINLKD